MRKGHKVHKRNQEVVQDGRHKRWDWKFDGKRDFRLWKQKMMAIPIEKDVDTVVEEKPELPSTMNSL